MAKRKAATDDVVAWRAEPFAHRLRRCVAMLHIHGIIPDAATRAAYRKVLAVAKARAARPQQEKP